MLSSFLRKHGAPIAIIVLGALITYFSIFDPVLYMDDWFFLRRFVFHQMPFIDWNSRRPLENIGFLGLMLFSGVNLRVIFVYQVAIHIACALAVYFFTRRILRGTPIPALPVALIFMVYPIDYTRLWITQAFTWIIFFLTVVAFYLLTVFMENGGKKLYALAIALLAIPLGAYEAQLGLIVAGSLILSVLWKSAPPSRRFAALGPVMIAALFTFWRLFVQPVLLNVQDPNIGVLTTSPSILLARLASTLPVILVAWIKPFEFLLPGNSLLKLIIVLAALLLWTTTFNIFGGSNDLGIKPAPFHRKSILLKCMAGCGLGLGLLMAGYIPIILYGDPNLRFSGPTTRFNLFAIYGATLLLVSMLSTISAIFAVHPAQIYKMVATASILLFCIGTLQQIWIQNEARSSWRQQQNFWRNLFIRIPNLKDGAVLLVVGPSRPEIFVFRRPPLIADWKIGDGLKVLYFNPRLEGHLYLPNYRTGGKRQTRLEPEGVYGYDQVLVPYSRMVIINVLRQDQAVRLIEDPQKELDLPFPIHGYDPGQWILPDPPPSTPYRFLVQQ